MSLLEHTFGKKGLLEGILTENTPNPLEDIDLEELEEQLPEIEDLIDDRPDADDMYAKLHDARKGRTASAEQPIRQKPSDFAAAFQATGVVTPASPA